MQPTPNSSALFRRLFLSHRPSHHAWRQPVGRPCTYLMTHHANGDGDLAAHLAGRLTIVTPLRGAAGAARTVGLAIDHGLQAALQQGLAVVQRHAGTAVALTSTSAAHQGGHAWLLFDVPAAPAHVQQLAADLAHTVAVAAETSATRQPLRLPGGVHRWTNRRGQLLCPDGSVVDRDTARDLILPVLALLTALPLNHSADVPGPIPQDAPCTCLAPHDAHRHAHGTSAGDHQATDLVGLLASSGGQIAARWGNEYVGRHCPCGHPQHGNRRPSRELRPATHHAYGRSIAIGHAPGCRFHPAPGQGINAFDVYCRLEHLTPAQATTQLALGRGGDHSSHAGRGAHALALDPAPTGEKGGAR